MTVGPPHATRWIASARMEGVCRADLRSDGCRSARSLDGRRFDASFVTSLVWTGVAKGGSQLVSWLATFVVARRLTPEDYGLVGMAGVFLGVVTIVSEFGLGVTIVTLRDLSEAPAGAAQHSWPSRWAAPPFWFAAPRPFRSACSSSSRTLARDRPGARDHLPALRVPHRSEPAPPAGLRSGVWALLETVNVLVLSLTMVLLARAGFRYWTLVAGAIVSAIVTSALTVASRPQAFRWPRVGGAPRRR